MFAAVALVMLMRFFGCFLLLCCAHPMVAQLPDAKPIPRVQAVPLPGQDASFQLDGQELTRYNANLNGKRPFWYPVQTSLAPSVIRIGHPHDPAGHRHHYGVWITHSAVSGVNFWGDDTDNGKDRVRGTIKQVNVLGIWDGDESASMLTLNHWVADRDGKILLIEKRHMEVRPMPDATSWMLVVDSEFTAPKGQTTVFEPSGFGLMSARMAKSIGVKDGGGRILNSEGLVNEKAIFRKPTKWCDYSGQLTKDGYAGIALFNHSANPNNPTAYHVRDDGWMCACLSLDKPIEVTEAAPVRTRYGLWVHEGVPDHARCESVLEAFAKLTPVDWARKP